jgi:cystathionine beta-lyase
MKHNFDDVIERRASDSIKWNRYGDEVLPLWVADMDFACPEPILEALHSRIAHGVFGYGKAMSQLAEAICERLLQRYHWPVTPNQLLFLPGLVCGLNLVCRTVGQPGDNVLVQTPVYPPFLSAPGNQEKRLNTVELTPSWQDDNLHYVIDYPRINASMTEHTKLFMLCHPHNPVGRTFSPEELMQLAEICDHRNITVCSDEIHCDLLLNDISHRPLASLSPELAKRCITLMAPSKTFNMPGLGFGFAIVQNPFLMKQLKKAAAGIVAEVNVLGLVAALAAYSHCNDWLTELLGYLRANRDYLVRFLKRHLPQIHPTSPEATYLVWLDCRQAGISGNPQHFFLSKAKVALNDGTTFGPGGDGFVRLNFGCPRIILAEALERMKAALTSIPFKP